MLKIEIPSGSSNVPISSCATLSFIDIMVPALYVAFMTRFGQSVGSSAYTDFGIISYGLGLVLSTLVMIMTRTIQPALFYTAPAMIVATFFIAMK